MGAKASSAATQPIQITADQAQRARVTVAHFSHGVEDCAYLLNMLGLDDPDTPSVPSGTRWQIPFGRDSWSKTDTPK